jgi:HSP20 family protein
MIQPLKQYNECLVYPGEYIPLPGIAELLHDLKLTGKAPSIKPLLNMDELKDCYKIEVALPGIKREDIFIDVTDDFLSFIILHKHSEELKWKLQIHEFDTDFLERHLLLPDDADTEFVCAEYKQGILSLHLPKSQAHQKTNINPIVVY